MSAVGGKSTSRSPPGALPLSIPAVQKYQCWSAWAMTKAVLSDGVEYVSDLGEFPVGTFDALSEDGEDEVF